MINNFKQIESLLKFEDENEFYFMQIIQRKKEHPHLGSNNKILKSFYIYSLKQYFDLQNTIISICSTYNARAYIHLNKKNSRLISFEMMEQLAHQIKCNQVNDLHRLYDSMCGRYQFTKDKTWIVDIDEKEISPLMLAFIDHECEPKGEKIYSVIPTKNGFHLITKPFNAQKFGEKYPEIDIHKNNPTILFAI